MFYQFEPIGEENTFQEFCKDLQNLIHNTHSFQQYKEKGASQNGIDCYSIEKGIVSQSKKKKLNRSDKTLENELIKDFNESLALLKDLRFGFNKFILFSTTKKYGKVQDYAIHLSNNNGFAVEFWSWDEIQPYIAQFKSLRDKYYPHLWKENIPKVLTYIPKIDESDIIGRQLELSKIEELLESSKKVVLVNGIGGVGKSTIAKLYTNKFYDKFDHIVWADLLTSYDKDENREILIEESFANNSILQANLNLELANDLTPKEKLLFILNKLQNIAGKNLFVLDNASSEILKYDSFLPSFPSWRILLTSREIIDQYSQINLEFLNDEDAEKLFYQFYKIEIDENVKKVIAYVGNHTLTVELLAKTANKRGILIKDLIAALEKEGLNIPKSAKVNTPHSSTNFLIKPFDYLLSIFNIADLAEPQHIILRYFSILPSSFISYDDLKLLFSIPDNDDDFFETLMELVGKGWIKSENHNYHMHQVIQEVLRTKLGPTHINCSTIIDNLSDILRIKWEISPLSVKRFVTYSEFIAAHIDNEDSKSLADLYSILGLREEDLFNLEKALKYKYKAVAIYKKDIETNAVDLSACYSNIQSIYKTMGNIPKALEYQLLAIEIQERVQHPLHPDLGTSYNNLALIYRIQGQLRKSLEYQQRAVIIAEATLDEKHPHLAGAYSNLSLILHDTGYLDDALKYQERSFKIRTEVLEKDHPLIAEAHGNLSAIYQAFERMDEAEQHLLISMDIRKRIYSERHYTLGTSYNNLASIYIHRKEFLKAEEAQKTAISIEEEALGENHFELATTYSTMAIIQIELKKIDDARNAVEKAISIAKFNFPKGHESLNYYYAFLNHINKIK